LATGVLDVLQVSIDFPGKDGASQLVAEDHVPRLGQLAGDGVLIVDQQPLEERQIELAAA
jgi:hypothetical protein